MFIDLEPDADRLRARLLDSHDETLHAPHLFDVEVLHALRRLILSGLISAEKGRRSFEAFKELRVTRYPHSSLVERIWELRANRTAYDASYVALAEALDAPLVTTDARLAQAPGHRARVELFS